MRKQYFCFLPGNEDGNRNMCAYFNTLNSNKSPNDRLKSLAEDLDTVILMADENKMISTVHSSPKNF